MQPVSDSNPEAWKDLGTELTLNSDALSTISVNSSNMQTHCWKLSWKQFIEVLSNIDLGHLATEIEELLEPSMNPVISPSLLLYDKYQKVNMHTCLHAHAQLY